MDTKTIIIFLSFGVGLFIFIWWLIKISNKAATEGGFNLK